MNILLYIIIVYYIAMYTLFYIIVVYNIYDGILYYIHVAVLKQYRWTCA